MVSTRWTFAYACDYCYYDVGLGVYNQPRPGKYEHDRMMHRMANTYGYGYERWVMQVRSDSEHMVLA